MNIISNVSALKYGEESCNQTIHILRATTMQDVSELSVYYGTSGVYKLSTGSYVLTDVLHHASELIHLDFNSANYALCFPGVDEKLMEKTLYWDVCLNAAGEIEGGYYYAKFLDSVKCYGTPSEFSIAFTAVILEFTPSLLVCGSMNAHKRNALYLMTGVRRDGKLFPNAILLENNTVIPSLDFDVILENVRPSLAGVNDVFILSYLKNGGFNMGESSTYLPVKIQDVPNVVAQKTIAKHMVIMEILLTEVEEMRKIVPFNVFDILCRPMLVAKAMLYKQNIPVVLENVLHTQFSDSVDNEYFQIDVSYAVFYDLYTYFQYAKLVPITHINSIMHLMSEPRRDNNWIVCTKGVVATTKPLYPNNKYVITSTSGKLFCSHSNGVAAWSEHDYVFGKGALFKQFRNNPVNRLFMVIGSRRAVDDYTITYVTAENYLYYVKKGCLPTAVAQRFMSGKCIAVRIDITVNNGNIEGTLVPYGNGICE